MLVHLRHGRPAWLLAAALLGLSTLLAPLLATAAGDVLDQQNTTIAPGFGGEFCSAYPAAQTFTAGLSGSLDRVSVSLWGYGDSGPVIATIQSTGNAGHPSGTVLGSGTLAGASVPLTNAAWVDINLTSPAAVSAGTYYALVLSAPIAACSAQTSYFWAGTPSDGVGAPGAGLVFYADEGWKGGSRVYAFKTYVIPTPPNRPPTANAGGPYSVPEGGSVPLSGSGADPDGDPLTFTWDLDNNGSFETAGQTPTFSAAGRDGPASQTVVLKVCDVRGGCTTGSTTVAITNVNPTVTISAPTSGSIYPVGTSVTFTGSFADPGTPDTHIAQWAFDGITKAGTVSESNGSGTVSVTHTFTTPSVYTVKLTVTDDDNGAGEATTVGGLDALVVVYDPTGGFVTGGGWFESLQGACKLTTACQGAIGKANFGLVSKYQRGATTPSGETEFQFKAGNLNFHSTIYEWLVVAGAKAQYKGSGTINGSGDYGFLLTVIDGQEQGGGGVDKFRIKIWDKSTGAIVYDNQMDAPDGADPSTALGGGSIVIHK